jgi:excisionase family DNA binding protein
MPTEEPLFWTAKDVATRWCMSLSAVYELAARGILPHYRFGSAVRFKREDIERFEANGRQDAIILPRQLRLLGRRRE